MIKRSIAWGLLVTIPFLLTGCWSRVEVNDLAIVSMMAIDQAEDGNLRLWLHVVVPAKAGGPPGASPGGGGGLPFITLSATGRSILEASKQIQIQTSRRLFWAHMRVIL